MARIRLAERKEVENRKKKLNLDPKIPVNIGDGPEVPLDYKVIAVLVLGDGHRSKRLIERTQKTC